MYMEPVSKEAGFFYRSKVRLWSTKGNICDTINGLENVAEGGIHNE